MLRQRCLRGDVGHITPGRSAPTVTLQVVVQKQAVVHGHEAEAGVVALLRDVPGGQTGVGQVFGSAADAPGPLQGLDVPRQTCTFTLKTQKQSVDRL